jgi:hypothetical protein
METSGAEDIGVTRVLVSWHFGHSKVCESKPGLSGSMIRNDMVSPHFEQRGLLILFANTVRLPFPGLASQVLLDICHVSKYAKHWRRFAQILCSERDGCLESNGWLRGESSKSFLLKMKSARCSLRAGTKSLLKVWSDPVTLRRNFRCDPNLQSLLLSLHRSSARRSLRLLKAKPHPARPMKEPSVPALPRKRHVKRA